MPLLLPLQQHAIVAPHKAKVIGLLGIDVAALLHPLLVDVLLVLARGHNQAEQGHRHDIYLRFHSLNIKGCTII